MLGRATGIRALFESPASDRTRAYGLYSDALDREAQAARRYEAQIKLIASRVDDGVLGAAIVGA